MKSMPQSQQPSESSKRAVSLTPHRLSLANIARSVSVIPKEFLNSPQYNCEPLSAALDCTLTLKVEIANPIRSFKGRGASFFVSEFQRSGDARAIVCASAGNWGQAMAYACRQAQLPIVIYASHDANPLKLARMQALGAQVNLVRGDFDSAKDAAKAYAKSINGRMVEDGFETAISEGHGTIGMELFSANDNFDTVLVPLGNGAMLNGMARWIKSVSPTTQIIGVCAEGADAMAESWRRQELIVRASADSIADGIAVRVPILEAVQDMHGLVDEVLIVSDQQIISAMQLVAEHAGYLLEPSGAVGVAAVAAHREQFAGKRLATVLCGGSLSANQYAQYVA